MRCGPYRYSYRRVVCTAARRSNTMTAIHPDRKRGVGNPFLPPRARRSAAVIGLHVFLESFGTGRWCSDRNRRDPQREVHRDDPVLGTPGVGFEPAGALIAYGAGVAATLESERPGSAIGVPSGLTGGVISIGALKSLNTSDM